MTLSGVVEIDGAYFGGHGRPANERKEPGAAPEAKQVVVAIRERTGRTLTKIEASEGAAIPTIRARVLAGSELHADEGAWWDRLHAFYEMKRINHSVAYSADGACTNQAESYFSRLRRAEIGQHRHVSGPYLHAYAGEMAWKEDFRRQPNGTQHEMVTGAALAHPVSRVWCGYWQKKV